MGEHIRIVQITQLIFFIVAVTGFYMWKGGHPLFLLFAVLLVGPWVSASHLAIFHPNQAGWRFLGFPLGILLLLNLRKAPLKQEAVILGFSATFLLLYNLETGICLAFGYSLFLISKVPRRELFQMPSTVLYCLAGAVTSVMLTVVVFRLGLGSWPLADPAVLSNFLGVFAQGYGALPLYFDPRAILIFIHCAYLVSFFTLLWWRRPLKFEEAFKLAIAAAILVWFTYYVNRPHPWNMWTYLFLYVFLIASYFDPRFLRHFHAKGYKAFAHPGLAAVIFILLPSVIVNNYSMMETREKIDASLKVSEPAFSGLQLPAHLQKFLQAKADFLTQQDAGTTLFFSHSSLSMSLEARRFLPLSAQDAFAETTTERSLGKLIDEILVVSPHVILYDAFESDPAVKQNGQLMFYNAFFNRMKIRLAAHYVFTGNKSGWEIWERKN